MDGGMGMGGLPKDKTRKVECKFVFKQPKKKANDGPGPGTGQQQLNGEILNSSEKFPL